MRERVVHVDAAVLATRREDTRTSDVTGDRDSGAHDGDRAQGVGAREGDLTMAPRQRERDDGGRKSTERLEESGSE